MIYITLFLVFFMIGTFSFGGGYGMISLVKEQVLLRGWLTEDEFLTFLGIAEATPGALAVNMATFVGVRLGGVLGAFVATLGVVMPSFLIILLICSVLNKLLTHKLVVAGLNALTPTVTSLVMATALTLILSLLFNFTTLNSDILVDFKAIFIFLSVGLITLIYYLIKKRLPSYIILIIISGILGIICYSL